MALGHLVGAGVEVRLGVRGAGCPKTGGHQVFSVCCARVLGSITAPVWRGWGTAAAHARRISHDAGEVWDVCLSVSVLPLGEQQNLSEDGGVWWEHPRAWGS